MPTNWKDTSYDSLLVVIVGRLTKMIHQLQFDSHHHRPASKDVTRRAGADTN